MCCHGISRKQSVMPIYGHNTYVILDLMSINGTRTDKYGPHLSSLLCRKTLLKYVVSKVFCHTRDLSIILVFATAKIYGRSHGRKIGGGCFGAASRTALSDHPTGIYPLQNVYLTHTNHSCEDITFYKDACMLISFPSDNDKQ